ncbi:hypothetical protein CDAR_300021 [Caerostris darwini]|uniref:Uncharacterized protein n=1 Tax=Caerostris darwini TaxID=1538125 RepID=A0AAV4W4F1_9ARAC|nr:hypothetical protein CDAR_300021 [Caerostris darwini]
MESALQSKEAVVSTNFRESGSQGQIDCTRRWQCSFPLTRAGTHLIHVALWLRILLIFCPQKRRGLGTLPPTLTSSVSREIMGI